MTKRTALIAGGGIGGLSAALALLKVGFEVTLFERSKRFEEVGAGITLRPSANRALHYLGLYEALLERGSRPPSMPVMHFKTGEVLVSRKVGPVSHADFPMMQVHRSDLIGVMVDALGRRAPDAMRCGHDLVGFDQAGDSVTARFADGSEEKGDVLIGCDGVRSIVRAQMFGADSPRFTGQVAWRCLIPMHRVRHLVSDSPGGTYIGPARVFTRYPIRQGALLNCVAFARTDAWKSEGWSTPSTRDELMAQFAGWHGDVLGLIDQAPAEGLIKWALFDRDPLPIWTQGRASLLGDAAHPMLPFLGLGAGVALEDSVVLARAIHRCSVPGASSPPSWAWSLGQNSSGGKDKLGRISKKGDGYLRKLLVVGATSVIRRSRTGDLAAAAWVRSLLERRPARVVTVAMANKTARIVWEVLTRGEVYRPAAA